jgi:hypothetical protein
VLAAFLQKNLDREERSEARARLRAKRSGANREVLRRSSHARSSQRRDEMWREGRTQCDDDAIMQVRKPWAA